MSVVSFQSLPILIDGYDTEGHLVLIDGQLQQRPPPLNDPVARQVPPVTMLARRVV